MKQKLPEKSSKAETSSVPRDNTTAGEDEELPFGTGFFANSKNLTDAQLLATVFPKIADALAKNDTKRIEGIAGLFSGFGLNLGVPVPRWVTLASKNYWDGLGFDFLTNFRADSTQLGKLTGLNDVVTINKNTSEPMQALQAIFQQVKTQAVSSSPDKHFEFAKGRKEAGKIPGKIRGISQRTKIYGIIATDWRAIEKFKSTEELYDWLMSQKNSDAASAYTLARATESREIRKICNRIGLKFQNKWTTPHP